MKDAIFTYSKDQLKQLSQDVLRFAQEKGASDAVVDFSESAGLSVAVRKGKIDTIEQNKDKGMAVTVYIGQQRGSASTSDFSEGSLRAAVDAAYNIACFTAIDDCAGLPEADLLATSVDDLHLYYPWTITTDEAVEIAKRAEAAALAVDKRITNSEGAGVSVQHAHFVFANSRGFIGGYPHSRHSISASPIAGRGAHMQRDYWYSSKRDANHLAKPEDIGRYASERALSRLNAKKINTCTCPVLFEAPIAAGLLGAFTQAVSGGALYRGSTFLINSLGTQVFPEHITIVDDPFVLGGMGSAPFDNEGVKTVRRDVVSQGIVEGYFLSSYSARKLGMPTTGNAGGSHNLSLHSSLTKNNDNLKAMLKKMGTGFFVTELIGQGVNYVTGDYSRGASGFWVEKGVIVHPVEEVTIAGNLRNMFKDIVAVGSDVWVTGGKKTGSILIDHMTIAGA